MRPSLGNLKPRMWVFRTHIKPDVVVYICNPACLWGDGKQRQETLWKLLDSEPGLQNREQQTLSHTG